MKKLEYITPEIEVTKFEVKNLMMDAPLGPGDDVTHIAGDGTSRPGSDDDFILD